MRVRDTDARRGTSGGYRVIYYLSGPDDVLLVAVYSKTEQDDIGANIIREIIEGTEE